MLTLSNEKICKDINSKRDGVLYVDLIHKDTKELATYDVSGTVVSSPYESQFGISMGVQTKDFNIDELKSLLDVPNKYKFMSPTKSFNDHEDVLFFKLRTNSLKTISASTNVELQDDDKAIRRNLDLRQCKVTVKCHVSFYFNVGKKEYGVFFKPVDLNFK